MPPWRSAKNGSPTTPERPRTGRPRGRRAAGPADPPTTRTPKFWSVIGTGLPGDRDRDLGRQEDQERARRRPAPTLRSRGETRSPTRTGTRKSAIVRPFSAAGTRVMRRQRVGHRPPSMARPANGAGVGAESTNRRTRPTNADAARGGRGCRLPTRPGRPTRWIAGRRSARAAPRPASPATRRATRASAIDPPRQPGARRRGRPPNGQRATPRRPRGRRSIARSRRSCRGSRPRRATLRQTWRRLMPAARRTPSSRMRSQVPIESVLTMPSPATTTAASASMSSRPNTRSSASPCAPRRGTTGAAVRASWVARPATAADAEAAVGGVVADGVGIGAGDAELRRRVRPADERGLAGSARETIAR